MHLVSWVQRMSESSSSNSMGLLGALQHLGMGYV
jgi:hypothetical protein